MNCFQVPVHRTQPASPRLPAGHLYAPNDYQRATELARELVLDESKRTAMAAAARAHVEKLGWMAAVKRIRDMQYQRAINTFRAHKRWGFPGVCCAGCPPSSGAEALARMAELGAMMSAEQHAKGMAHAHIELAVVYMCVIDSLVLESMCSSTGRQLLVAIACKLPHTTWTLLVQRCG